MAAEAPKVVPKASPSVVAEVSSDSDDDEVDYSELFQLESHVLFCEIHLLRGLPAYAQAYDLNRMTLAYFAVSTLDLLGRPPPNPRDLVDWVYAQQVLPGAGDAGPRRGGFRPGPYAGLPLSVCRAGDAGCGFASLHDGDVAHATMSQCALQILTICGDDLRRVDREAVVHHLSELQVESGCCQNIRFGSEKDVRFLYGACIVCELLQDWSGLDQERAVQFLAACQRYDGGFGESPRAEGHGGTTYCAVAALAMLRRLDVIDLPLLVKWIVHRQGPLGFNGRPNKLEDTCYSFWLGCTLAIVQGLDYVDTAALTQFTLRCQDSKRGGIAKAPGKGSDLLHTYVPIAALGLFGHVPEVAPIDPVLGFSLARCRSHYDARAPVLRAQVEAQLGPRPSGPPPWSGGLGVAKDG